MIKPKRNMAKIPFNVKFRPQIESGEYKVAVADGYSVHIVCWDAKRKDGGCICGFMGEEEDVPYFWQPNGNWWADGTQSPLDLFIVTPEPELSEFESKVKYIVDNLTNNITYRNVMKERFNRGDEDEQIKEYASELLAFARKEIVHNIADSGLDSLAHKIGYQKGFEAGKAEALRPHSTELTENLVKSGLDKDSIPYHLIEFMCNLYTCQNWKEIEETAEAYATRIKAAALKDLPRWRKVGVDTGQTNLIRGYSREEDELYRNGKCISLVSLEKLPGFKSED